MRVLSASFFLIILDQITKYLTRTRMDLHDSIPVIRDFFHLTYVTNTGMAFGINFPAGIYIFTTVSLLASVGILWYLWTLRNDVFLVRFSLALIWAGAVGNLIDRIRFGQVVDFFDFMWSGHHFPVFNIADSSVTVGMIFFLYYSLVMQPKIEAARADN